ncbi:MAG TPA: hypothetical protein VKS60_19660 [Stellaceae bacterium]|nr:hypothetical protein [Stellaceae bacterium]
MRSSAATLVLGGAVAAALLAMVGAEAASTVPQTAATAVTVTNPASRPVQGQDIDQPVRNFYQQLAFAPYNCVNNDCYVIFPAVPANTRTVITHVSCDFIVATGTTVFYSDFAIQGTQMVTPLPLIIYPVFSGDTEYGINSEVYSVFTAGQIPQVDIDYFGSSQPADARCTIAGYSVNVNE